MVRNIPSVRGPARRSLSKKEEAEEEEETEKEEQQEKHDLELISSKMRAMFLEALCLGGRNSISSTANHF